MSDDNQTAFTTAPAMTAETGFEGDESQAPIRVSGFISALLAVISSLSFLAIAMLVVPMAAIGFGLFALRRHDGPRPVGTTAAYIGILMAVLFGTLGVCVPLMRNRTLGGQATYFAREYLRIVARDDLMYASELKKEAPNRFLSTMSLELHYESEETAQQQLEQFRSDSLTKTIQEIGPDVEWELDRAVEIDFKYGRDVAHVYLTQRDPKGKQRIVHVKMECYANEEDSTMQWYVSNCQFEGKLIVAKTIL